MKKVIALLISVLMIFALTACGSGNSTNTDAPSNSNESSEKNTANENNTSGELTVEAVMNAPVSAESDFIFCVDKDDKGGIAGYEGTDEIVVIPETIDGEEIKYIEQYCFSNRTQDKAIRFSDTVEYIEDMSCGLNENLEIVILGKNTKSIGEGAFLHDSSLKEVVLNDGLETIVTLAFGGCDSLKSIYIPESVTNIEYGAFSSESGIEIHGKAGSYAEQYAKEHNHPFVAE